MKVLITGVGGFVGAHCLRHIMDTTDWDVVGLDSYRHHGKLDRVMYQMQGHDRRRYTHMVYDLAVPITYQTARDLWDVDYVIAMASESHVERSIQTPRPFVENNVALALTMLEWAKTATNLKAFIQVGTDEEFGPIHTAGHPETAPYRPSNPYSASKAMQGALAYSYWRTYGVPVIQTHTMNLFGEMQDVEKYTPKVIRACLTGETLTVHANADGVCGTRFYMHAKNQADALVWLLKNTTPTMYPAPDLDRYNIAPDTELDNLTFALKIADLTGFSLKYTLDDFHRTRPGHDLRYGLDGSKLRSLGWAPTYGFNEALKHTVLWTMQHKEWLSAL